MVSVHSYNETEKSHFEELEAATQLCECYDSYAEDCNPTSDNWKEAVSSAIRLHNILDSYLEFPTLIIPHLDSLLNPLISSLESPLELVLWSGFMPWFLSWRRIACSAMSAGLAGTQLYWIAASELRFRDSHTWKSTKGTITRNYYAPEMLGATNLEYTFVVDGKEYQGKRLRSGSIWNEESLQQPQFFREGSPTVVYYDPHDPTQSAISLAPDRGTQFLLVINVLCGLTFAYRAVRCPGILPGTTHYAWKRNKV